MAIVGNNGNDDNGLANSPMRMFKTQAPETPALMTAQVQFCSQARHLLDDVQATAQANISLHGVSNNSR